VLVGPEAELLRGIWHVALHRTAKLLRTTYTVADMQPHISSLHPSLFLVDSTLPSAAL
jgi:hypothetical protein